LPCGDKIGRGASPPPPAFFFANNPTPIGPFGPSFFPFLFFPPPPPESKRNGQTHGWGGHFGSETKKITPPAGLGAGPESNFFTSAPPPSPPPTDGSPPPHPGGRERGNPLVGLGPRPLLGKNAWTGIGKKKKKLRPWVGAPGMAAPPGGVSTGAHLKYSNFSRKKKTTGPPPIFSPPSQNNITVFCAYSKSPQGGLKWPQSQFHGGARESPFQIKNDMVPGSGLKTKQ